MFSDIYIEALLVNEDLADQVWDAWNKGEIDDAIAYTARMLIRFNNFDQSMQVRRQ